MAVIRQKIAFPICLLVAITFFAVGASQVMIGIEMSYFRSSFYISDNGVSKDTAQSILNQNRSVESHNSILLWGSDNNKQFCPNGKEPRDTIPVIYFYGDSRLLFSDGSLDVINREMCAISRGAAKMLFGKEDVVGLGVIMDNRGYFVQQVVPCDDKYLIVNAGDYFDGMDNVAEGEDSNGFDRLEVQSSGSLAAPTSSEIESQYNLSLVACGYRLHALLICTVSLSLPLALYAYFICSWRKRERLGDVSKRWSLAWRVMSFAMALVLAVTLSSIVVSFGEYFPTRWSSFVEWSQLWDAFCQGVVASSSTDLADVDAITWVPLLRATVSFLIAAIFLAVGFGLQIRIVRLLKRPGPTQPESTEK